MRESLEELDGVFTYICVTKDALGVAKDEMAAKPLVLYEADDLRRARVRGDRDPRDHRPRDRHLRPVRRRGAGVAALGEHAISYDARGLSEPDAAVPKVSEIDGTSAEFDAHDLSTRQINLELRWLLNEQGVTDVTVRNPGCEALARRRHPHPLQDHLRRQPRLLRLRHHRRARGAHQGPRRLVVLREHDVGRRRDRPQRRLAHGRRDPRRRPRRQGPRRRPHGHRPEGRHDHRARRRPAR